MTGEAEGYLPDLQNKQSNEGTEAFFDWHLVPQREQASKLIDEIKHRYTTICELDVDLIVNCHRIMREKSFRDQLPYGSIVLFMEFLHGRVVAG
ncbi:unnamed protein product [Periconia digitata]|uniref:Uncharacterized protein n=1 Tax=Periconia digitata TaxID=1303443 RepID=A0A9W4XRG2_9PLEO|nr:unnamed protein product [Periconia digitata]